MKNTDKLRDNAEKELQKGKTEGQVPESDSKLVHELQVHQIELKMQNEELRESQREYQELSQKYFDLYNSAPVGYFILDKNGIILDANLTGESLLGIKKQNLISNPFILFVKPEFRNLFYNKIKNIIETRTKHEFELELIKKDKSTFWTLIGLNFTEDENYYRITVMDITERKIAEEALKEAHNNLEEQVEERTNELKLSSMHNRSLIEASLDPLVTIGPDGEITDANKATEIVTGYSRNELINTDFSNYFTEPEKAKKGYERVFIVGEVRDYPLNIIHKNGSITPVLYNASVYKDVDGEAIGVFAAARDITEINKAYNNLNEVIEELKRSNQELQNFAYITSHDLQEPLRSIASYAQLIERRYKGQLDEDADDFLDYMVSGAKRMKDQIQGLLEYSSVDTQGGEFKDFNAENAFNTALSSLKSPIEEHNAKITHDKLPVITADESQISRVFQNLIGNALKFRKEEVKPEIHISAQKEGNEYIFSVQDNGIGLEEQYTDQIFEVFKRLHAIGEYQGIGIGLAIVKRIIDRHGGEIWVESELGEGSTFYFTISN